MSSIIITAALTGPIAMKSDNPALPITPAELADAAEACYKAGAAIVHLHIRDEKGAPTVDLKRVKECLDAIHERVPQVLTQLSTGGIEPTYEDRSKIVELRPRMASLNPCTMSFGLTEFRNPPKEMRKLAARMRELGVKPELEIYDYGHLDVALSLLKEGLLAEPLQFSIVLGVAGGAAATPQNLVGIVSHLPKGTTWQVIAVGRANLELTTIGVAMGGNARTGLEDTLYLRKGVLADNASLVKRLVQVCTGLERPIATPEEAVKLLQLPEMKQA
jgi:3-keto-5-aminohexanoate cleavage enzyme